MIPMDLVAFWIFVGLFVATYVRGRRRMLPAKTVRVGSSLEERRAAVDPAVVAHLFDRRWKRDLDVDEQLRRAAGGRRSS